MTRPDDIARQVQQFDPPARPGLLARLWARLTAPSAETCPRCRRAPGQVPDSGDCSVCNQKERAKHD